MHQFIEFMGHHPLLFTALGVVIVLLVADEIRRRMRGVMEIGTAEAVRLINNGGTVIDVRKTENFNKGHLIGARNLPADSLENSLSNLKLKADKPIIICGDKENSAVAAAAQLRKLGYSAVSALRGGVDAWRRDNLPLTTRQ